MLDYKCKESGIKPRDSFSNFTAAGSLLVDQCIEDIVFSFFYNSRCVCECRRTITGSSAVISQRCSADAADAADAALHTGTQAQLRIGTNYQVCTVL